MENKGTLYIVATPIGNLQDITLRAIEVLLSVPIIAAEDTRRTGLLLKHIVNSSIEPAVHKPQLLSYYDQNEQLRIPQIITTLENGLSVALVSDAGTPLISDPGFKLVREVRQRGIKIQVIPGASSVLTALIASGLPTDKFLFAGYPPHKSGHRLAFFENIKSALSSLSSTIILFEAPHKLVRTLTDMQSMLGDIQIILARELTKMHEEVVQLTISEAQEKYKKIKPKGEFVILFHL